MEVVYRIAEWIFEVLHIKGEDVVPFMHVAVSSSSFRDSHALSLPPLGAWHDGLCLLSFPGAKYYSSCSYVHQCKRVGFL